ncbi:MAG: redoxin domain-containing protein [Verrucomicrobiota bacterium JB022]|nr:redoxin domain-containing protein [Verrucomicrobiota bacterium JB022]
MALSTGTKAPDFTLKHKTADGMQAVKLSDNFGKKQTVLLFFPFAFTSVCTDELCTVSGGLDEYDQLDAAVYGISVDSPFTQEVFAQRSGITFPLLSDFNKEVSKAYDVIYDTFVPGVLDFHGVSKRAAFVIGKDGVIKFASSSDDPKVLPPFDQIKTALKA